MQWIFLNKKVKIFLIRETFDLANNFFFVFSKKIKRYTFFDFSPSVGTDIFYVLQYYYFYVSFLGYCKTITKTSIYDYNSLYTMSDYYITRILKKWCPTSIFLNVFLQKQSKKRKEYFSHENATFAWWKQIASPKWNKWAIFLSCFNAKTNKKKLKRSSSKHTKIVIFSL